MPILWPKVDLVGAQLVGWKRESWIQQLFARAEHNDYVMSAGQLPAEPNREGGSNRSIFGVGR